MSSVTLDSLRNSIAPEQRSILDDVWRYFAETGNYIPVSVLRHRHGRYNIDAALTALGGRVVMDSYCDGKKRYIPTLLAALLTSDGERVEGLLVQCLEYALMRYEADPEIRHITDAEMQDECELQSTDLLATYRVVSLYSPRRLVSSGGASASGSWILLVSEDIDILREFRDARAYLASEVTKDYDPSFPVAEGERLAASMAESPAIFEESESGNRSQATNTRSSNEPTFNVPLELTHVQDPALRLIISCDWQEIARAASVEAWKSCVLLCGSILEGLLLALVRSADPDALNAAISQLNKGRRSVESLGLSDLQALCEALELLPPQTRLLSEFIRSHRNLIHPGLQSREQSAMDSALAFTAARVVVSIADHIARRSSGQSAQDG